MPKYRRSHRHLESINTQIQLAMKRRHQTKLILGSFTHVLSEPKSGIGSGLQSRSNPPPELPDFLEQTMNSKQQTVDIARELLQDIRGDQIFESQKEEEQQRHREEMKRIQASEKRRQEVKRRTKQKEIKASSAPSRSVYEDTKNKNACQQTFGRSLAGQTFYSICPDNENYYKTIFVRFNPFTNALQPMMSNPIYGVPPDGMPPIHPKTLQQLLRLQQTASFRDF